VHMHMHVYPLSLQQQALVTSSVQRHWLLSAEPACALFTAVLLAVGCAVFIRG
jgi:hypothetical protein